MKRQQRNGSAPFIKNAIVTAKGVVEFSGRKVSNQSTLAVAMVNANGGNAKALNGYDFLFVENGTGPVPLDELRRHLLEGTPAEQAAADVLVEDTETFGNRHEALAYVRENPRFFTTK